MEFYQLKIKEIKPETTDTVTIEFEIPEDLQDLFSYTQGQYIKSFPLHESQIIITENSKEVVIGLSIYITWDFIKELLSWGPDMEVISPATLKTQVKSILKKTLKQYD